ncbi:hypothetical protein GCM10009596_10330 [Arthrobacter rhombi]
MNVSVRLLNEKAGNERRKDNTYTMTNAVNEPLAKHWNLPAATAASSPRPALMVTWAVEESFGGMTTMCLKRASIFQDQGTPSAVVTFHFDPDQEAHVAAAVHAGKLSREVDSANVHFYYSSRNGEPRTSGFTATATDQLEWTLVSESSGANTPSLSVREFTDVATETLRRREYYREDGSLYLLDCQLPSTTPAGAARRVLQLIGSDGRPAREFKGAGVFYRHWLSEIVGDLEVDVVIDSKFMASMLWRWNHPGATKSAVLHSTHVKAGHDLMTGPLNKNQQGIVDHRDDWDRMVLLTHGQAEAFRERLGDNSNITVISNPVDGPTSYPSWEERDRYKMLFVGRLAPDKHVDKAIRVLDSLVRAGTPATLDIIGDGPKRDELEALAGELGLQDHVHFTGYVSDVPRRLDEAGSVILCSKFEGQPLALLEAKAHGCVPVAFDISFGPRDVITPGVSGVLADYDDLDAMSAGMAEFLADESLHERMSRAAFEEAQSYTGPMIFREWTRELETARAEAPRRQQIAEAAFSVGALAFADDGGINLTLRGRGVPAEATVALILKGRQAPVGAATLDVPSSGQSPQTWSFDIPPSLRNSFPADKPVDFHVRIDHGPVRRSARLGINNSAGLLPLLTGYGNLSIR